jgi:hypothetical protein
MIRSRSGIGVAVRSKTHQKKGARSMSTEYIRDSHYHVIGSIRTNNDGKQTAYDAHSHMLGIYDPKMNLTRDAQFRVFGAGNQLSALIRRVPN